MAIMVAVSGSAERINAINVVGVVASV